MSIPAPSMTVPASGLKAATEDSSYTSSVLILKNMMDAASLENDEEYGEVLLDVREECDKFGTVADIKAPRSGVGKGKIYVHFEMHDAALKARDSLHGRMFDAQ